MGHDWSCRPKGQRWSQHRERAFLCWGKWSRRWWQGRGCQDFGDIGKLWRICGSLRGCQDHKELHQPKKGVAVRYAGYPLREQKKLIVYLRVWGKVYVVFLQHLSPLLRICSTKVLHALVLKFLFNSRFSNYINLLVGGKLDDTLDVYCRRVG